ncbi:type II secretion system minor pseudopilin GspJ [Alteromonas sp. a30]|uniref:type II secretion system minor pseudopilin GspJ n=1 Tax=Alteromonas sp. a30 TaxID=2730917 RepID=UPI00227DBFD1|nr:type II secretion system minor pseudopilin GspJ [Alteromonas sp. a30]MCY7295666.1 type II secretion system minor pseudopilin GspJ [Alteromonas sp. a30]
MLVRRSRGFTLLEIMVAIAIFTIIGLASNSVLNRVLDSDEASQEKFAALQRLQRIMLTIERDLLQATARPVRSSTGDNKIVLKGGENFLESEADGIGFVRLGWQNPQLMLPRSTLQAVGYRLQEGRLEKVYSNYVDNVVGAEPRVKVLLEDVEDFQVEFFLRQKQDAEDTSNWGDNYSGEELPKAVALIIETKSFGRIRREFALAAGGPA